MKTFESKSKLNIALILPYIAVAVIAISVIIMYSELGISFSIESFGWQSCAMAGLAILMAFIACLKELADRYARRFYFGAAALCSLGILLMSMKNPVAVFGKNTAAVYGLIGGILLFAGYMLTVGREFRRIIALASEIIMPVIYIFGYEKYGLYLALAALLVCEVIEYIKSEKSFGTLVRFALRLVGAELVSMWLLFHTYFADYAFFFALVISVVAVFCADNSKITDESLRRSSVQSSDNARQRLDNAMLASAAASSSVSGRTDAVDAGQKADNLGQRALDKSDSGDGISKDRSGFMNIVPTDSVWSYLINKETHKAYRYDFVGDKIYPCGEGFEPEFKSLIAFTDYENIMDAVKSGRARSIKASLWNIKTTSYQTAIVNLIPVEQKPEYILLLGFYIGDVLGDYEDTEYTLRNRIEELTEIINRNEEDSLRIFLANNELLTDIINHKSAESADHMQNVMRYVEILLYACMDLYPEFGLTREKIETIKRASALHDIGKIMVPDSILNKPGSMTKEEYEQMKLHTIYGAELIGKMPYVKQAGDIIKYATELALHHQERVDGSGYPDGLKGDEIPFYVQILALADCYEALTATRVYRKSYPHDEAVRMICNGECGAFSDWIIECLKYADKQLGDAHYTLESITE